MKSKLLKEAEQRASATISILQKEISALQNDEIKLSQKKKITDSMRRELSVLQAEISKRQKEVDALLRVYPELK